MNPLIGLGLAALAVLVVAVSTAPAAVQLTVPPAGQSVARTALTLTVPDMKGSYTIPYIQSGRDLQMQVNFAAGAPTRARLLLLRGEAKVAELLVTPEAPMAEFLHLQPGEYTVRVGGLDPAGEVVCSASWSRVGVGTVIGAIGDSITEGYHGNGFWRDDLNLRADMFPPSAVSKDGRNFPQYSPTTAWHRPDINCFQSWLTDLNNLLTARWQQPVFIANEGYGGITAGRTLETMRGDAGWQQRMRLLHPQVWLIHLGVNDERAKVPATDYAAQMDAIVEILTQQYAAKPEHILICGPCYDYAEGAAAILQSYIQELDALIARRGLRHGPDFFAAYAQDKAKWYGDDPVHPNVAGMEYMARLWSEAIIAALPDRL